MTSMIPWYHDKTIKDKQTMKFHWQNEDYDYINLNFNHERMMKLNIIPWKHDKPKMKTNMIPWCLNEKNMKTNTTLGFVDKWDKDKHYPTTP